MIVFTVSQYAYAGEGTYLYRKAGPDGTVTFLTQETEEFHKLSGTTFFSFEVHRVIAPEKTYYAIRACLAGVGHDTAITDLTLKLDGKDYSLTPLANTRKQELPNAIQEWYAVDDGLLNTLEKATTIKAILRCADGKTYTNNTGKGFSETVHRIGLMTKDADPEELYTKYHINSAEDRLRLFIPDINPEQLGYALVYKMNYWNIKGKPEFIYGNSYQVRRSPNWSFVSFEYMRNYFIINSEADHFYTWISLLPQDGGTWVIVKTMAKSGYYQRDFRFIGPWENASNNQFEEVDKWANALIWIYNSYHGKYTYGLDWDQTANEKDTKKVIRAQWKPGPFVIQTVDPKGFPELAQVKPGDKITAINGISTSRIQYKDSVLLTSCSGKTMTFTILDSSGAKRDIIVQPKFEPSIVQKQNYQEIVNKDTHQFSKYNGDRDCPLDVPEAYNPLGAGYQ